MKLKLGLMVGMSLLVGLTGALAYAITSGCNHCGATLAGIWGVTILVLSPVFWGLYQAAKGTQVYANNQNACEHEYVHEEYQEVLAWHGDSPIWCIARARRCWKCAYVDSKELS